MVFRNSEPRNITPARKFRMLLHINPTRQRGKRTGSLARALGWYMTFFAAGLIVDRGASRTKYAFFKYHLVRRQKAENGSHYHVSQLRSACAASHNQPVPSRPNQQ